MFRNVIKTYERVGTFITPDNKKVDILIVYLQKGHSLDRARVTQRNFAGRYLVAGGEKDAGLFAFVAPGEADWRFSLVKMEYKFEKTKTGKVKVKEEFTPARRWSFLVGANEKSHTTRTRLVNMLANDEQAPTLEEIEKSFDIETVAKEFFREYHELFMRTKEELDRVVKNDPKIEADFAAKGVDTVNFARKLLGQITFLYFLREKGWFGLGRDHDRGTGSKHFFRELFEKKHGNYNNFFNDILEPLFYEALRSDRGRDHGYYSRFNCKIPCLGSGLFDPIGNYDWVHIDINIPDRLFSNTNKTKQGHTGDGILDIFDRYNFTVKEDDPLDKEVAIDPELLGYDEFRKTLKSGKTGEQSKFNKKFGVYYTPREIVRYMCQQSLINYLAAELDGKVSKEDIETLVHSGDHVSENEETTPVKEQSIKQGKPETPGYQLKLPQSIHRNAALIDQKLAEITVCDPAVGSGAFPVGMMSEIVKMRNVLSNFLHDDSRTPYEFKRRCIEHSLYGVDIDPGAVEITKLRLWLSLVADEEDLKNVNPLPNLDYKIVCGNSLQGLEKNLFNKQPFNKLEKLKPLFFNETNPGKKQEYKKKIDELFSQITSGHKEFDFEVYFSEIFHQKGGFDVVIANPPYITIALGKKQKFFSDVEVASLKKHFKEVFEYKGNTFTLFFARSIGLLNRKGVLTFITPNTMLLNPTFRKTRRYILNNCSIKNLVSITGGVFASGETGGDLISILSKSKKDNRRVKTIEIKDANDFNYGLNFNEVETAYYNEVEGNKFYLDVSSLNLMKKINNHSLKLGDIIKFYQGIITGDNKRFLSGKKLNKNYYKILRGRDVHKFFYIFGGTYVHFDKELLWSNTNERLFQSKEKLINRQTGADLIAAYDDEGMFTLDSTHIQILKSKRFNLKYILALFNSKLLNFYYHQLIREEGRVFAQVKAINLKTLPIRDIPIEQQKPFVVQVDQILAITKHDDYLQNPQKQAKIKVLEAGIDRMVYHLYGLTPGEIKIVARG